MERRDNVLMRYMKVFILLFILFIVVLYYIEENIVLTDETFASMSNKVPKKVTQIKTKDISILHDFYSSNIDKWIGKSEDDVRGVYGEPLRIDPSAYGYDWWIYVNEDEYVQFGLENHKVVTLLRTGINEDSDDMISIGQSYNEIFNSYTISDEINYENKDGTYTFRLTEEDIKMRPLIKVSNNIFIQLNFDTFTNRLSSLRVLEGNVLLKHRSYEIVYRGELPDTPLLTDNEWRHIEAGMEQQIFDITNIFRKRFQLDPLELDNTVSEVAYLHSLDMAENNYFSHFTLNGDGLKERLAAREVFYVSAGENIAAQYTDSLAAMEGWLNSKGHRDALLNKAYSHIGIGVYRLYYTQNFLGKAI